MNAYERAWLAVTNLHVRKDCAFCGRDCTCQAKTPPVYPVNGFDPEPLEPWIRQQGY